MKLQHWNVITAVSIALIVGGYWLSNVNHMVGRTILLIGVVIFFTTIIGSTYYNKKKPMRCPHCGGIITPMGRRFRGGIHRIEVLDVIPCPHCGATFSSYDYLKSEQEHE